MYELNVANERAYERPNERKKQTYPHIWERTIRTCIHLHINTNTGAPRTCERIQLHTQCHSGYTNWREEEEKALLPFERWLEFYASIHRHSSSSGSSQEPSARANIEHFETSKTRFRLWCIYLYMCSATHRYSNADGHQLSEYANERSWMAYGAAHISLCSYLSVS